MRMQFVVSEIPSGWMVRRGQTSALIYDSQPRALLAAENFARAAARQGDDAVVTVMGAGAVLEARTFKAERDLPPHQSAISILEAYGDDAPQRL
jgi:hypothetical protein